MLIDYKNVTFSHKDNDYVLEGVNFTVEEGELIYIIGKVGSGKSSLLKTFYGDMEIDTADKAMVLGRDMMDVSRKEIQCLRREMGIIFQDFQLLTDRSVKKNLEFVLMATGWKDKSEIEDRVTEVLKAVKMTGVEDKMPHELSGGEQQRIAIARSLLNSPKIILADEPTGNLDPETADQIISLFNDIVASGTSVVMTTHNLPILERFPGKVFQCDEQKFVELSELER